jgi:TatD DNase family protein
MKLVDTHCHIHSANYELPGDDPTRARWLAGGKPDPDAMIAAAHEADVVKLICVGTDLEDSRLAVGFVKSRQDCAAAVGLHPHEAARYASDKPLLAEFARLALRPEVAAIGECGLDYYYEHSPRQEQQIVLRYQLDLALEHDLPLIFHVRDAFDDFWRILDEYSDRGNIRGVVHSFTDTEVNMREAIKKGLSIGLNGIMTFTKDVKQLDMAKAIPLESLLLETDAPYLTPKPFRGKMCEPKHVRVIAEFLCELRGESLADLAAATSLNAERLFGL